MALHDAIEYLKKNSGVFPLDELATQLRQHGYPDGEIRAAVAEWQKSRLDRIATAADTYRITTQQLSFWQKAIRFGAGFLLGGLLSGGSALITHYTLSMTRNTFRLMMMPRRPYGFWDPDYIFIIDGIVYLVAPIIAYFWLRRSSVYIARGVLASLIISILIPLLFGFYLWMIFRGGRGNWFAL